MNFIVEKNEKSAYLYGLKLLGRREYSTEEMKNKLAVKFGENVAIEAVEHLVNDNSLSDMRYACMVVRHFVMNLSGPKKIMFFLKQKGVPEEIIGEAIDEENVNFTELAVKALHSHYDSVSKLEKTERNKAVAFLYRRGFVGDDIQQALEE